MKIPVLTVRDEEGNIIPIPAIQGERGEDYILTEADKQEIATMAVAKLSAETWTFTLEDGSTVTKTVVLK
jgi:hypothetical protein